MRKLKLLHSGLTGGAVMCVCRDSSSFYFVRENARGAIYQSYIESVEHISRFIHDGQGELTNGEWLLHFFACVCVCACASVCVCVCVCTRVCACVQVYMCECKCDCISVSNCPVSRPSRLSHFQAGISFSQTTGLQTNTLTSTVHALCRQSIKIVFLILWPHSSMFSLS